MTEIATIDWFGRWRTSVFFSENTAIFQLSFVLFVCVEVLRPSQQLRSFRAGQLPINTVPGQA